MGAQVKRNKPPKNILVLLARRSAGKGKKFARSYAGKRKKFARRCGGKGRTLLVVAEGNGRVSSTFPAVLRTV